MVIQEEKQTEFGYNLMAVTNIDQKNKPNLKTFKKAFVDYKKAGEWADKAHFYPSLIYVYGKFFQSQVFDNWEIEVIKNVKIEDIDLEYFDYVRTHGDWQLIQQFSPINIFSEIEQHLRIKQLLKNKKWFQ